MSVAPLNRGLPATAEEKLLLLQYFSATSKEDGDAQAAADAMKAIETMAAPSHLDFEYVACLVAAMLNFGNCREISLWFSAFISRLFARATISPETVITFAHSVLSASNDFCWSCCVETFHDIWTSCFNNWTSSLSSDEICELCSVIAVRSCELPLPSETAKRSLNLTCSLARQCPSLLMTASVCLSTAHVANLLSPPLLQNSIEFGVGCLHELIDFEFVNKRLDLVVTLTYSLWNVSGTGKLVLHRQVRTATLLLLRQTIDKLGEKSWRPLYRLIHEDLRITDWSGPDPPILMIIWKELLRRIKAEAYCGKSPRIVDFLAGLTSTASSLPDENLVRFYRAALVDIQSCPQVVWNSSACSGTAKNVVDLLAGMATAASIDLPGLFRSAVMQCLNEITLVLSSAFRTLERTAAQTESLLTDINELWKAVDCLFDGIKNCPVASESFCFELFAIFTVTCSGLCEGLLHLDLDFLSVDVCPFLRGLVLPMGGLYSVLIQFSSPGQLVGDAVEALALHNEDCWSVLTFLSCLLWRCNADTREFSTQLQGIAKFSAPLFTRQKLRWATAPTPFCRRLLRCMKIAKSGLRDVLLQLASFDPRGLDDRSLLWLVSHQILESSRVSSNFRLIPVLEMWEICSNKPKRMRCCEIANSVFNVLMMTLSNLYRTDVESNLRAEQASRPLLIVLRDLFERCGSDSLDVASWSFRRAEEVLRIFPWIRSRSTAIHLLLGELKAMSSKDSPKRPLLRQLIGSAYSWMTEELRQNPEWFASVLQEYLLQHSELKTVQSSFFLREDSLDLDDSMVVEMLTQLRPQYHRSIVQRLESFSEPLQIVHFARKTAAADVARMCYKKTENSLLENLRWLTRTAKKSSRTPIDALSRKLHASLDLERALEAAFQSDECMKIEKRLSELEEHLEKLLPGAGGGTLDLKDRVMEGIIEEVAWQCGAALRRAICFEFSDNSNSTLRAPALRLLAKLLSVWNSRFSEKVIATTCHIVVWLLLIREDFTFEILNVFTSSVQHSIDSRQGLWSLQHQPEEERGHVCLFNYLSELIEVLEAPQLLITIERGFAQLTDSIVSLAKCHSRELVWQYAMLYLQSTQRHFTQSKFVRWSHFRQALRCLLVAFAHSSVGWKTVSELETTEDVSGSLRMLCVLCSHLQSLFQANDQSIPANDIKEDALLLFVLLESEIERLVVWHRDYSRSIIHSFVHQFQLPLSFFAHLQPDDMVRSKFSQLLQTCRRASSPELLICFTERFDRLVLTATEREEWDRAIGSGWRAPPLLVQFSFVTDRSKFSVTEAIRFLVSLNNKFGRTEEAEYEELAIRAIDHLESAPSEEMLRWLPQLVQIARWPKCRRALAAFLVARSLQSVLFCHTMVWLIKSELASEHCGSCESQLQEILEELYDKLPADSGIYLQEQLGFIETIAQIGIRLNRCGGSKELQREVIRNLVTPLRVPKGTFLPTQPSRRILSIDTGSGAPMPSATHCPFLLRFNTADWDGPDAFLEKINRKPATEDTISIESPLSVRNKVKGIGRKEGTFGAPKRLNSLSDGSRGFGLNSNTNADHVHHSKKNHEDNDNSGVNNKIVNNNNDDDNNNNNNNNNNNSNNNNNNSNNSNISSTRNNRGGDLHYDSIYRLEETVSSENSPLNARSPKIGGEIASPSVHIVSTNRHHIDREDSQLNETYDACIFKAYDDCRHDALVDQVARIMKKTFDAVSFPAKLIPYGVIPTRIGDDHALGGIVHVIPDVKSRDQIGKLGFKTLKEYFVSLFGPDCSSKFREARENFVESLVGYSLLCYLMQIKDRHDRNILIDGNGSIIHIDYGFILGLSPGGNMGFETAAFKLTAEMIELMGGKKSAQYFAFIRQTIQGFLVLRDNRDEILAAVEPFLFSDLPCFRSDGRKVLQRLFQRFLPQSSPREAAKHFHKLILDAGKSVTTTAYDLVQRVQNGIQ